MIQELLLDDMDARALRFHLAGRHGYGIGQVANLTDDMLTQEHLFATKRDTRAGVLRHEHNDDVS